MAKPSVGKTGKPSNDQPGGTMGNLQSLESSKGGQFPFLPSKFDGAMREEGSSGTSGTSDRSNKLPFLPDKPE